VGQHITGGGGTAKNQVEKADEHGERKIARKNDQVRHWGRGGAKNYSKRRNDGSQGTRSRGGGKRTMGKGLHGPGERGCTLQKAGKNLRKKGEKDQVNLNQAGTATNKVRKRRKMGKKRRGNNDEN